MTPAPTATPLPPYEDKTTYAMVNVTIICSLIALVVIFVAIFALHRRRLASFGETLYLATIAATEAVPGNGEEGSARSVRRPSGEVLQIARSLPARVPSGPGVDELMHGMISAEVTTAEAIASPSAAQGRYTLVPVDVEEGGQTVRYGKVLPDDPDKA